MKKNKLKIISIFLLILIILCSLISSYSLQENIENQDQNKDLVTGFYNWTWESKDKCNSGTGNPNKKHKIGILFGGEKADEAINKYKDDSDRLKNCDKKFLNLGGGLKTGSWSVDIIEIINNKYSDLKKAKWDGVCFDIEVCVPSCDKTKALSNAFSNTFKQCEDAGLEVLLTTNITGPYDLSCTHCRDDILAMILNHKSITYISPQLYGSSGKELPKLSKDLMKRYELLGKKILPSIPKESDWEEVRKNFSWVGGYILWMHNSDPSCKNKANWCGKDWNDASNNCNKTENNHQCPNSVDSDCSNGYKCFANINCSN